MIFLIIITLGMMGFRFLPVDLLPPVELPELSVQVSYPNVGPEDIELLVTEPLENVLSIVPDVEQMTSASREGNGSVTLRFAQGVNIDVVTNDVREALDRARRSLPEDADPPRINRFNPDDQAIVVLGVQSDMDLMDLTTIMERELARRFEQIGGVGAVDVWGGIDREIRVEVRRDRLLASGLTMNDISAAIGREGSNAPGGNVQRGLSDLYVRSMGEFTDVDEIRDVVIRNIGGVPVRVGDVADVSLARADIGRYIEIDEVPMLRMGIRKQSGANTVAVAEAIRTEMQRVNQERSDLSILLVTDQSEFIQESIDSVRNSAVWGGILAVIVLMSFFRNGSITSIISISIPIAIIATFALLYFGGLTLNQMSFGGLALGVGLIVDNAIVVIENIVRHRQGGASLKRASQRGTKQVTGAIVASTITTSVIFLPVVFMQTLTGTMFQELALVVVFALMCSLLVALTLVPMLSSRFLSVVPDTERTEISTNERVLLAVEGRYEKLVGWALTHKLIVVGITAALLLGSVYSLRFVSYELTPQAEADTISVRMRMDEGTNIAILHAYMMEMNNIIRNIVPWENVVHYTRDVSNSNAELELTLVDLNQRTMNANELADYIRARVESAIPGMRVWVRAQSGLWIMRRIFGSGGDDAIQIQLRGYDLSQAEDVAQAIRERVEVLPGIADVNLSRLEGRPEQRISFDRERMAALGIGATDISRAIQASIGGSRAGVFRDRGDEIDIIVRLRPEDRLNVQDIDNISVRAADGQVVPVSSLVTTLYDRGPTDIRRINGQRVTYINANLESGVALGDAVDTIRSDLATMDLPAGFSIVYGGEYEEQIKAQRDFVLAIVMALVLIYMVMAAQFERFLDPLIVMASVPLAIVGVVPTLIMTGTTLNMQSFMGMVMLIGIVVNNAILLVDYINIMRREEKLDIVPAVMKAGRLRLRPILMTTMTTVLGLLPLALGIGAGAEMQAALARVVVGGLIASTLITLVLIPVVYVSANVLQQWLAVRLPGRRAQPPVKAAQAEYRQTLQ
ncbi:Acriflavine resistance protein (Cation efflux system) [Pseudohongiella spirulinae]|uniref:Acriflavine resistance protein (Cation efflux system) n=2 Tax=Pseudohongiella spirulinae TaxID=1249552 RepID=A0A0S2KBR0_9GAMM|nr:Acriflavine resistance protein (Cation efflux system) [Pseudohongiella spirulinae]